MRKDPILACLLSLLLAGIGHIYLGQTFKGLVVLVIAIAVGIPTRGIAAIPVTAWAMYDAYKTAKKREQPRRRRVTDVEASSERTVDS